MPLLVLALLLYLGSVAARMLTRTRSSGDRDGDVARVGEQEVERVLVAARAQVAHAELAALLAHGLAEAGEALGVLGRALLVERGLEARPLSASRSSIGPRSAVSGSSTGDDVDQPGGAPAGGERTQRRARAPRAARARR